MPSSHIRFSGHKAQIQKESVQDLTEPQKLGQQLIEEGSWLPDFVR